MNSVDVIVVGTGSAGSARAIRCAKSDWRWNEGYATQPEVLRYAHHVAERFELRRDIELIRECPRPSSTSMANAGRFAAQKDASGALKPKVFMPSSGGGRGYRRILEKVAADGYSGFTMTKGSVDAA